MPTGKTLNNIVIVKKLLLPVEVLPQAPTANDITEYVY